MYKMRNSIIIGIIGTWAALVAVSFYIGQVFSGLISANCFTIRRCDQEVFVIIIIGGTIGGIIGSLLINSSIHYMIKKPLRPRTILLHILIGAVSWPIVGFLAFVIGFILQITLLGLTNIPALRSALQSLAPLMNFLFAAVISTLCGAILGYIAYRQATT